ncbi:hypothetical protein [Kaistella palustris]|uniref:hypothetical protein n=1 Tax=Kaistella palustris TaxID=493376 RepID=UPI0004011D7E|nr:hypothetical protein [Kaistella palustris]
MKNRKLIIILIFLMLSVGNFSRLTHNDEIRPIEFLSIFLIGVFSGLLISELVVIFRARKQNSSVIQR